MAAQQTEMLQFIKLLDEEEARQVAKLQSKARERDKFRFAKRMAFEKQLSADYDRESALLEKELQQVSEQQAVQLQAQVDQLDRL